MASFKELGIFLVENLAGIVQLPRKLAEQFEGDPAFKDRTRTLELIIVNGTRDELRFCGEHFDSGAFYYHPDPMNIPPGHASFILLANRQGAIMCGVCGSLDYHIADSRRDYHLHIGFNHPYIGTYKNFIDVGYSFNPKKGYDMSKDDTYKQKTVMGYNVTAALRQPTCSPHKRFEYRIIA